MNLVSTVFEISFSPEFERGAIRGVRASRTGRVGMTGDEEPIPDVSRRRRADEDRYRQRGIALVRARRAQLLQRSRRRDRHPRQLDDDGRDRTSLPPGVHRRRLPRVRPRLQFQERGLHLCFDARPVCVLLRAGSNQMRCRSTVRPPDFSCPPGMFCAVNTCCPPSDGPFNVCTPFSVGPRPAPLTIRRKAPASRPRAAARVKTGAGTFGG